MTQALACALRSARSRKLAQGQEVALEVFDAGLDDALLLRVMRRAGVDLEAVAFGTLGIGALHGAGPGRRLW
jgi:hypothetical protein